MPRSSTTGNQALIFTISNGVFTQEPNPSPSGSTTASAPNIRYESVSSILNLQIIDTPNPFQSSAQPRTATYTLNTPLNATGEYYLSAVTGGSTQPCLTSNEVEPLAASTNLPWILHRLPALQAFNNGGRISSGTWLQVFGDDLASTTRSWAGPDFQGAQAPTSLDGVRVNINGRPAAVSYIGPNQVNAQVPDDETSGNVEVEVVNSRGASNRRAVEKAAASPALLTTPAFVVGGKPPRWSSGSAIWRPVRKDSWQRKPSACANSTSRSPTFPTATTWCVLRSGESTRGRTSM